VKTNSTAKLALLDICCAWSFSSALAPFLTLLLGWLKRFGAFGKVAQGFSGGAHHEGDELRQQHWYKNQA